MEKQNQSLVISGGGAWGLLCYGALRESYRKQFWNINNVGSIYATSVGTILAVMISLIRIQEVGELASKEPSLRQQTGDVDWDFLDSFLLSNSWESIFAWNIYSLLDAVDNRGLFSIQQMKDFLAPLFKQMNEKRETAIHIETFTLQDFFVVTGIEFHCFVVHMEFSAGSVTTVDISHVTHPHWTLLNAVYASCAVPILFAPLMISPNEIYLDGGFFVNYPLEPCLRRARETGSQQRNETTVIAFRKINSNHYRITDNSSLFDYLILLLMMFIQHMTVSYQTSLIKYEDEIELPVVEFQIPFPFMNIVDILDIASNVQLRKKYIEEGSRFV